MRGPGQALFKSECGRIPGSPGEDDLRVGQLNSKLDELVAAESRGDQETVLRWLVTQTTPTMMKWICCIILKDVRVPPLSPPSPLLPTLGKCLSAPTAWLPLSGCRILFLLLLCVEATVLGFNRRGRAFC